MTYHDYKVQLQTSDGQIEEVDYRVQWNSEKIPTEEIARACAAEKTVGSGAMTINGEKHWKRVYLGLSAVLQP